MRSTAYLIGAAKAGTTALATYLSEHPDVFLPVNKEPGYWSDDFRGSPNFPILRSLDEYRALYAAAPARTRILLDASTTYLMSSRAVPRILEAEPEARFIVLLRDPLEMASAFHMEQVFATHEDVEDFATAWRLQAARAADPRPTSRCPEPKLLQYRQIVALGAQLARVTDAVPPERLLILFQEDMRDDPRAVYARCLAFLGLEDDGRDSFEVVGAAHFHRFPAIARLYQNPPAWLAPAVQRAKTLLLSRGSRGTVNAVKSLLMRRGRRREMPADLRREIAGALAEEVRTIERLTGRDLSHWARPVA